MSSDTNTVYSGAVGSARHNKNTTLITVRTVTEVLGGQVSNRRTSRRTRRRQTHMIYQSSGDTGTPLRTRTLNLSPCDALMASGRGDVDDAQAGHGSSCMCANRPRVANDDALGAPSSDNN